MEATLSRSRALSSVTRTIARVAAYSGGSVGALGACAALVLLGQALRAKQSIPVASAQAPACDGRYGATQQGEPIKLAVVGDSTAAGYGVPSPAATTGAQLASRLAQAVGCPVELRCVAKVGAKSADLAPQVSAALASSPDIALILVGGNDVTHRVRPATAARYLTIAVRRFVDQGVQVVVGTCPDLGVIGPIQPPLRWIASRWSRDLAAAQTIGTVAAGGRTVSLGDLLAHDFATQPALFSYDRFHPSTVGYGHAVEVLLPSVIAALGYEETLTPPPSMRWATEPIPEPGVQRLAKAAVAAAGTAGTEVAPAQDEQSGHDLLGELHHRLVKIARLFPRTP